jgi:hypothetical protein
MAENKKSRKFGRNKNDCLAYRNSQKHEKLHARRVQHIKSLSARIMPKVPMHSRPTPKLSEVASV